DRRLSDRVAGRRVRPSLPFPSAGRELGPLAAIGADELLSCCGTAAHELIATNAAITTTVEMINASFGVMSSSPRASSNGLTWGIGKKSVTAITLWSYRRKL